MNYNKYSIKNSQLAKVIFIVAIVSSFFSCKKFIDIEPPVTSVNNDNVYAGDATAAAVLTGIYTEMSSRAFSDGGIVSMSLFPALSADELSLFDANNTNYLNVFRNQLTSNFSGSSNFNFWNTIYPIIFVTNSAIEGLSNSTSLTPEVKQHLIGEAKFIRAFCYFYLVNLYGDACLATSTDWKINSLLPRVSKSEIWQHIVEDLKAAQSQLSSNYLRADIKSTTIDKVRPTKWAAIAMLARTYLYTEDWANAEANATSIINNNSLFALDSLNGVFLKNSKEAIWQLLPVGTGNNSNTGEGRLFILPIAGPNNQFPVFLSNYVINSFESSDQRKSKWVDSVKSGNITYFYPFKYKVGAVNTSVKEYSMVLRLGEQFLIRAEARAQQNKLSEAIADLDQIRQRAGLPLISMTNPGISKSALLNLIFHERQVELFTEWGHRWFDLKRTNNVDAVMSIITPQKGGIWNSNWQLYPIILSELLKNPNLQQNPGY